MRRLFGLALMLILGACAQSVPPTAPRPIIEPAPVSAATFSPVSFGAQAPRSPAATTGSYQYGRFNVRRQADGGQVIEGGVFRPPVEPALWLTERLDGRRFRHLILVDFVTKELHYYHREGERWVPNIGYAVVTPEARSLPQDVVVGHLTRIDTAPVWGPPARIRADYAAAGQPLPAAVPFGDPRNMLGAARFEIDWRGVQSPLVRLHGAVGYPADHLATVDTYGCVSLLDEAILTLIDRLGGPQAAVRDGTAVIFHRRGQVRD